MRALEKILRWIRVYRNGFGYDGPVGSIPCPDCKGIGLENVHPNSPLYGTACDTCCGTGWYYIPTSAEMG